MASADITCLNALVQLFECPVCLQNYKDPYILKCGHHFCKQCLEGIVKEDLQGSARCPTCRRVTEFTPGSGVTDLPRPVLINELQEKITSLLDAAKRPEVGRYCDICLGIKVKAATHCNHCRRNLCMECDKRPCPKQIINTKTVNDMRSKCQVVLHQAGSPAFFISGITMDVRRRQLIARTSDAQGPLKVYDYQGRLQESLGTGVAGLASDTDHQGVCVDSLRGLIAAPCMNWLLLVCRAGCLIKAVRVGGGSNSGVTYGEEDDIFVISDSGEHLIYVMDAASYRVIRHFRTGHGEPNYMYVHIGHVTRSDRPLIVVSNSFTRQVRTFDTSGKSIRTYCVNSIKQSGDLSQCCGVCTDYDGHVIVCDADNDRLVALWTNRFGQHRCEALLNHPAQRWTLYQPRHLALDKVNMLLAVVSACGYSLTLYS